jgi:membrane-associated phospholipid phosphatase
MTERTLFRPGGEDPEPRFPSWRRLPLLAIYGASQILLFMGLFQIYKSVRKVSIPEPKYAFENARQLLDFQGKLGLNFELDLQRWVLDQPHFVILAANRVYAHYMIGFYVVSMLCLLLAPERYRYLRRAFFISMVVALPWFYLYPLAPPRFLAEPHVAGFEDLTRYNFLDTLVAYGPIYFSSDGVVAANRYAAMPSMHCGWAMIGGFFISAALPWRWVGRSLIVIISLGMGFTVMVTGNHYWSDVIGGWIVIAMSLGINRWLPYPLPIRWPWQSQTATSPVSTEATSAS